MYKVHVVDNRQSHVHNMHVDPHAYSHMQTDLAKFHLNPLSEESTRSLLSPQSVEGTMAGVIGRTMTHKSHGPTITIQRINTE